MSINVSDAVEITGTDTPYDGMVGLVVWAEDTYAGINIGEDWPITVFGNEYLHRIF